MRRRNLKGLRVVVTRSRGQAAGLTEGLRRDGARVVSAPLIQITPPASGAALDRSVRAIAGFDAVVFTSVNAVRSLFSRARRLGLRPRPPRRIYAIGVETAKELRRRGWECSVPRENRAAGLIRSIPARPGWRVLIPRAREAREELPAALRRRGAFVTVVEAYRTRFDASGCRRLKAALRQGTVDAVTFTSGSTVRGLVRCLGRARTRELFSRAQAVSIGPVTSAALRRMGIRPGVEARRPSAEGLRLALRRALA